MPISGPKSFDASTVSPDFTNRLRNSNLPLLSRGLRPFALPNRFLFSFKVPFVCADCRTTVYWPGGTSGNSKVPFSSAIEYLMALYCCGFPLVPSAVLVATKFWSAGISTRPLTSHTLLPVSGLFPIWKSKKYVSVPLMRPVSAGCAVVEGSCDGVDCAGVDGICEDGRCAAGDGSCDGAGCAAPEERCDNVSAICPSP